MIDTDFDNIEDIEACLYSQVYHVSKEQIDPKLFTVFENNTNMRRPGRYFEPHGSSNSYDNVGRHIHTQTSPYDQFNIPQAQYLDYQNSRNLLNPVVTNYALPSSMFMNPVNNIVVIPPPPTQIFTTKTSDYRKQIKEKRKQRRRQKKKEKWQKRRDMKNVDNRDDNITKTSSVIPHAKDFVASTKNIIDIISSDDSDDCVELPAHVPTLTLSSDDETEKRIEQIDTKVKIDKTLIVGKQSVNSAEATDTKSNIKVKTSGELCLTKFGNDDDDDDVVYVAASSNISEVIDLDVEMESNNENPISLNCNIKAPLIPETLASSELYANKEKSALLKSTLHKGNDEQRQNRPGTPESSVSNDFLDNTVELSQNKFNFGLHGTDFNAKVLAKPKPQTSNEPYETESSASDISTPIKTAVFNEIPFENSAKDIFTDTNLENFKKYITTKRSTVNVCTNDGTNRDETASKHKKRIQTPNSDSSESSSESDYDESKVNAIVKKTTKASALPTLSTFSNDSGNIESTLNNYLHAPQTPNVMINENRMLINTQNCQEKNTKAIKSLKRSHEIDVTDAANISRDKISKQKEANESDDEIDSDWFADDSKDGVYVDEDEFLVISDSESRDHDFKDFNDVDLDLELANCKHTSYNKQRKISTSSDYSNQHRFSNYWSEDKEKFYRESWGNENFNTADAHKLMSDNSELWKIVDADRSYNLYGSSPKGPRCNRCRRVGHKAIRCPNKAGPPKCSLCGRQGHLEPRCPNKICTNCGRYCGYSTTYCSRCAHQRHHECRTCRMVGHIEERCPDLWRRYYLTTEEGPLVRPQCPDMKEKHQLCCSGCGRFGHLEHSCRYFNRSHPAVNPRICKYEDVYGYKKRNKSPASKDVASTSREELRRTELRSESVTKNSSTASASRNESRKAESTNESVTNSFSTVSTSRNELQKTESRSESVTNNLSVVSTSREELQRTEEQESATNNFSFMQQFQQLQHATPISFRQIRSALISPNNKPPVNDTLQMPVQDGRFQIFSNMQNTLHSIPSNITFTAMPSQSTDSNNYQNVIQPKLTFQEMRGKSNTFDTSSQFIALDTINSNTTGLIGSNAANNDFIIPSNAAKLKLFVRKCIRQIENMCASPKLAESQLTAIQNAKEILNQTPLHDQVKRNMLQQSISEMYQQLNMFIFGCHKFRNGKKHYENLRKNLHQLSLQLRTKQLKRDAVVLQNIVNSVHNSYNYIFGDTVHNYDYGSLIEQIKNFSDKKKRIIFSEFNYFRKRYDRSLYGKKKVQGIFKLYEKIEKGAYSNNDVMKFKQIFHRYKKMFEKEKGITT